MKHPMQSLSIRFLIVIFLVLAVGGILLNRATLNIVKKEILSRSLLHYQQIIENEALRVDAAITEGSLLALALAHSPELQNLVVDPHVQKFRQEAESRLESFLATNRRFSGGAVISSHYQLLLAVLGKDAPPDADGNHYWAASFEGGVDPFNAMARIPVFIDQVPIPSHQQTQTRYMVPILDRDTVLRGIVALDLSLSSLLETLHFSHLNYNYMVLDEEGDILQQFIQGETGLSENQLLELRNTHQSRFIRNPGGAFPFSGDGEEFMVIFRRITPQDQTGLQFTLVGLIPANHIYGSVSIVERVVTSSMVAAFLLIFLLLAFYIFRHVQPIRALALSLNNYRPGEAFSISTEERRRSDEIGYLHRNFANLIDQLENAFSALQERVKELGEKNRKLEQATQEAYELGQAKSDFLAVMSHEIRTPLNAIVGYAKLVESEVRDPECRQYCQRINANSDRLLSLIDNILDFTRISSGRTTLDKKPFFPAEELENLHLDFQDQVKKDTVKFLLTFTGERNLALIGDVNRWHQIIDNLISNALKFTDQGMVHLDARVIENPRDPHTVLFHLDVIDTGMGIPPEKLEIIFEPFEQADNSMRRRFQGTGLGLAISRRLVNLMGGTMHVRSQVGKGSCFSVRLPFSFDRTILESASPEPEPVAEVQDLRGLSFLIVEDDEANAAVFRDHLLHHGASRVEHVDTEKLLIHELAENTYDCILMDTHLGDDDGIAMTRRIRQGLIPVKNEEKLLIYVVSAHIDPHGTTSARAIGAQGYWAKPINFKAFLNALQRDLRAKRETTSEKS